MPGIYLRRGEAYIAMTEKPYDTEDVLQRLIERHPEMLAGDHGPLMLVRREAGVAEREGGSARYSLDHLYLDRAGIPTLVEVKRSTDTRSRREVVAQMLDYAANASASFSSEQMVEWLEQSTGVTADDALSSAFGDEDAETYWQTVDTNLKAERFRLVFVSDAIGEGLRRIIEFLNSQMSRTEVLAIEVKQYVDADGAHQTIVPRVVGDTAEARAAKRPSAREEPLDREGLLASIRDDHGDAAAEAAAGVLEWAEGEPRVSIRYTGTGGIVELRGQRFVSLWNKRAFTQPLSVHLRTIASLAEGWDERRIATLVDDLAGIDVELKSNRGPLDPLADDARLARFTRLMTQVLDAVSEPRQAATD